MSTDFRMEAVRRFLTFSNYWKAVVPFRSSSSGNIVQMKTTIKSVFAILVDDLLYLYTMCIFRHAVNLQLWELRNTDVKIYIFVPRNSINLAWNICTLIHYLHRLSKRNGDNNWWGPFRMAYTHLFMYNMYVGCLTSTANFYKMATQIVQNCDRCIWYSFNSRYL